ncbi:MAG: UDP-N-acetylmuramate--L-alanine ligase [Clostridia bacterium]|nr:UDP-N-acetylmuramate--L-alanine ligase [Clostridia bacterium]
MEFDEILAKVRRVHFIGIGGSGMCPLVEILHSKGYKISGSDVDDLSDTVNRIRSMGINVVIGQRAENITDDMELVVYTAAIQKDNPELLASVEKGIPTVERSVLLGAVCRKYPNTIGVSGTHGKTTVTSMITQILMNGNLDPSAIIGGKLPLLGTNGRAGDSDTMVVEACEFVNTFLQITPAIAVILNIDADHLEFFGNVENIIKSFHQFCLQTTDCVIVNGDDRNSMKAVEGIDLPIITFGFEQTNDYYASGVSQDTDGHWMFDLVKKGEKLCRIKLHIPGRHNILNALAAAAASLVVGATPECVADGIDTFGGACRRFEIHGIFDGVTVADDYAHHPAELEATLRAAKEMNFKRIVAVFQPFTYSRTRDHLDEFAQVLSLADETVLTEIMAAREVDDLGVSSSQLAAKIPNCKLLGSFEEIADYIVKTAKSGDLVITMGCGDIYKAAKMMKKKYTEMGL